MDADEHYLDYCSHIDAQDICASESYDYVFYSSGNSEFQFDSHRLHKGSDLLQFEN